MFQKPRKNRIFQDVVAQVQEAILDGRLAPGQKLPPERELGELFETSRGTLREALRVLEQKGLIEIRLGVGGGAVVRDTDAGTISESLAMLIRSRKVSLQHLAEFREDIESSAAALAAQRAAPADLDRLYDLIGGADACYARGLAGWNDFVRIDEQVHIRLSEMTRNPMHGFIVRTIHDNIHRYYDRFLSVGKQEFKENAEDLRDIVAAVAGSRPELAGHLARKHVRRFHRYMEQKKRRIQS